ncbi:hypothetical protein SLEP1_g3238 [Rubroshorea leprosula]|uniref:Uncharacterized protein n=1 Tax=Rubroshorea leprosula TaxID=152421 RepID=A0AAV5HJP7_9ROSI|nr:hypothetical protein SLEP1_g3238 [Rubroshorea leprosula]
MSNDSHGAKSRGLLCNAGAGIIVAIILEAGKDLTFKSECRHGEQQESCHDDVVVHLIAESFYQPITKEIKKEPQGHHDDEDN